MSQNYLPSKENFSIFAGELYFQPDGAARARSMGHADSFTWTPNVEVEDVYVATSGIRQKVDELITEISASVSLTLKETTILNMAAAMQGEIVELTQAAQTATVQNETNVMPGEIVDLMALDVLNVSISDGTNTLVNGVDYVLNAEAGIITVYKEFAQFDITFDAPEIVSGDNKKYIEVLSSHSGISGIFHIIGKNQRGKRYAFRSFRATLKPSGDVQLLSDGSALQQVELEGSCTENEAAPLAPWGVLQELN